MMRRVRGFTLIEVLAAFAVLALGIAIVVSLLNGGRRQVRYAADMSYAAQFAQSLLDAQGINGRLHEGESDGSSDDERVRWHLEIREIDDPLAQPRNDAASGAGGARLDDSGERAGDAATDGTGEAGKDADTGDAGQPATAPGKVGGLTSGGVGEVVEPLQLMHLQLDLEWGSGGPRERAHFSAARVQMRGADDEAALP